jgi:RNA polymerase sigma factor (sigma-70 family)
VFVSLELRIRQGHLRKFREERNLSQAQAAAMAGVHQAAWCAAECFRLRDMKAESIQKIAALVEVDPALLVPDLPDEDIPLRLLVFREMPQRLIDYEINRQQYLLESSNESDREKVMRSPEVQEAFKAVLKSLTYREREVLKLRYGLGDADGYTYTLEEVGKIFKVTREVVRQVEARAIRKLQHPLRVGRLLNALEGEPKLNAIQEGELNRLTSEGH